MKVEIERLTNDGQRSIRLIANDVAQKSYTVREWIKMLRIVERWLREKEKTK